MIPSKIQKKHLVYGVAIVLIFGAVSLFTQWLINRDLPYVLSFTQPVKSFNGTIMQNDGKGTIEVLTNTRLVRVTLTNATIQNFQGGLPSSPYLLKPTPSWSVPPVMTVRDLTIGSRVTVNTAEDLRTLRSLRVTATHILLLPFASELRGEVTSINDATIIINGVPIDPLPDNTLAPPQSPTRYTIRTNRDTEISRIEVGPISPDAKPAVSSFTLAELEDAFKKEGQLFIHVYAKENVDDHTTVTALRIEPSIARGSSSGR